MLDTKGLYLASIEGFEGMYPLDPLILVKGVCGGMMEGWVGRMLIKRRI